MTHNLKIPVHIEDRFGALSCGHVGEYIVFRIGAGPRETAICPRCEMERRRQEIASELQRRRN